MDHLPDHVRRLTKARLRGGALGKIIRDYWGRDSGTYENLRNRLGGSTSDEAQRLGGHMRRHIRI